MKPTFKYIHDTYFKRLCFMANRYVHDEKEGEDIVSQLMMRLWERWKDFQEEEKIKAFLYISLRNACLNFIVTKNRENNKRLPLLEDSTESIEANIIHAEVLNELHLCIEKLPPQCQKVCKAWMNCKKGEAKRAAQELGLSINTFWSQLQKARALMQMHMKLPYNENYTNSYYKKHYRK